LIVKNAIANRLRLSSVREMNVKRHSWGDCRTRTTEIVRAIAHQLRELPFGEFLFSNQFRLTAPNFVLVIDCGFSGNEQVDVVPRIVIVNPRVCRRWQVDDQNLEQAAGKQPDIAVAAPVSLDWTNLLQLRPLFARSVRLQENEENFAQQDDAVSLSRVWRRAIVM
jgi:hypothetical protein